MMSNAAESGAQMSDEEISSTEKIVQPAKAAVEAAIRKIDNEMVKADPAKKAELTTVKEKVLVMKKNGDGVALLLKGQRDQQTTSDMLKKAAEKIETVAAAMTACQDAEMPFLKGMEVLPG